MSDNRGLTNRVTISNAIERDLHEKLTDFSRETRIPKSKLLDEAIHDLLKKHNKI
jgi:hypothetical protein